jgi:hypothetical protein
VLNQELTRIGARGYGDGLLGGMVRAPRTSRTRGG